MTHSGVGRLSAWLIALSAVEVLIPLIDILSLPLPRYVMSIPLSTAFVLIALGLLVPLAQQRRVQLIGSSVFALLGLMALWAGLEVIGIEGRITMRFDLVRDCIPLLLVMIAARLHLQLFGNHRPLVSRFIMVAGCLVLAHTVALLLVSLDVPIPFINGNELSGRNSMALLIPVCLWLLTFFPLKSCPLFSFRYNLFLTLALINILMSSARSAMIVVLWCVLAGLASQLSAARKWLRVSLLPLGITLVASVVSSSALLTELGQSVQAFVGQGDDALSVWSRAQTNAKLLNELREDPLLGLGWEEVAETKVYGYMGHTLYVNVVSGYGAIGALAAAALLTLGLLGITQDRRENALHLLFLAFLIASFSNNVFVYFGLMIALVESAAPQTLFQGVKKNGHQPSCVGC